MIINWMSYLNHFLFITTVGGSISSSSCSTKSGKTEVGFGTSFLSSGGSSYLCSGILEDCQVAQQNNIIEKINRAKIILFLRNIFLQKLQCAKEKILNLLDNFLIKCLKKLDRLDISALLFLIKYNYYQQTQLMVPASRSNLFY